MGRIIHAGRGVKLPEKLYMVVARQGEKIFARTEGLARSKALEILGTWKVTMCHYGVTLEGPFILAKVNPKPGKPTMHFPKGVRHT
jgi:hypothetical protein